MTRKILMIPGPTEVQPEILATLLQPTIPHYGSEFVSQYRETTEDLKKFFGTNGDVILHIGPGSAALEMAVASIIEEGDKVLTFRDGFFDNRMREIVVAVGGKPVDVDVTSYENPIDPERVREKLRKEKGIKAIVAVHNETSTGVLNNIDEVGQIAQDYHASYIVDSISALGGIEIQMDKWNIDICVGTAQKCLGALGGVNPTAINKKVWEKIEMRKQPIRGWYLNLATWRDYIKTWGDWHPYPTTMPEFSIRALHMAVRIALKEGLKNRYQRHQTASKAVRKGLESMNIEPFVASEYASPTVTAAKVPPSVDVAKLRKTIDDKFNIIIGSGIGRLQGKIFRIAHMAMTASHEYIIPTLIAVGYALREQGLNVKPEDAAKAAEETFGSS